jgi:hypothetical protein
MSTSVSATHPLLSIEPFVSAETAMQFLSVSRKFLLAAARKGEIPAHPWGDGPRKVWRFLLSELDQWLRSRVNSPSPLPPASQRRNREKTE